MTKRVRGAGERGGWQRMRARKRAIAVFALPLSVLSFLAVGAIAPRLAHAQLQMTPEYSIPTANAKPSKIVAGPDGNLWFTELTGPNIGRITPSGSITEFPVPSNSSYQQTVDITNGPGGNLWFTDWGNNAVGEITTAGVITEFPIPTANSAPYGIAYGPDGNLWITQLGIDDVAKVTPSGAVTEYPITAGAAAQFIKVGADGNMWFAEYGTDKIGQITPAGVLTEYSLTPGSQPNGIASGPDGNLWFTEDGTNNIGVMSTSGTLSAEYAIPTSGASPADITVGSDGTLWFAEYGANGLGQVTTGGTITEYPTGHSSGPNGVTAGPDGNIWYTGYTGSTIGTNAFQPVPVGGGLLFATSPRPTYGTAGPDGNMWFTDYSGDLIQITPSGTRALSQPFQTFGAGVQLTSGADGKLYIAMYNKIAQVSTRPIVNWEAPVLGTVNDLTSGPDGNVWFASEDSANNKGWVGFLTPAGKVKQFLLAAGSGFPQAITAGSDGALWFLSDSGKMGRITTNGAVTFFPLPAGLNIGGGGSATLGPDGNVWFTSGTDTGPNYVLSISPTGIVRQFTVPTPNSSADGITAGADGNLWFNEAHVFAPGCPNYGGVARITTAGVITEYDAGCNDLNDKFNIIAGPDGNVWNGAYYGTGINGIATGASTSSCKPITAAATSPSVGRGSGEAIVTTIANCATIPQLTKLETKVVPPGGCSTLASHVSIPLQPWVQTTTTSGASTQCKGTYKVKLTLLSGGTVLASTSVTYKVT